MSPTRQWFLFLGLPLLIIFAVVAIYALRNTGFNRGPNQPNNTSGGQSQSFSNDAFAKQYQGSCDKSANPVFTTSPLPLDQTAYIVPMGLTNDGHVTPTDHVYETPLDANAADNTYQAVMPANGRVVEMARMPSSYIGDRTDVKLPPDDFRLVISFSCRYYAIFIHVHKLSAALATALPIEASKNKTTKINLKAGDLLAQVGPNGFDWTMVDTQTTLPGFITSSLYSTEPWKIHSIDPFSLYTGATRTAMEAKSLRTVAPLGGKIDFDKAGKLIGNWFKQGTNGYQGATPDRYWDGHLSIAPDNIDPNGIVYSTGNWQGKAAQFVVKGAFKPETITVASGLTKIELIGRNYLSASVPVSGRLQIGMKVDTNSNAQVVGVVLLQVMPGEKLKVEQFPGKTSNEVAAFTTSAATYVR